MSCGFVAFSNLVSYDYILVRQLSATLGSTFTYNVNSSGPKMFPCYTPTVTGSEHERLPSIITVCYLPCRYDVKHLISTSGTP